MNVIKAICDKHGGDYDTVEIKGIQVPAHAISFGWKIRTLPETNIADMQPFVTVTPIDDELKFEEWAEPYQRRGVYYAYVARNNTIYRVIKIT